MTKKYLAFLRTDRSLNWVKWVV